MGYVSIAASYRLGWLANSTNLDVRRGSNLLAVYYSIQDAKALSSLFEPNPGGMQVIPFGIDR
jgi:hypothetical protein